MRKESSFGLAALLAGQIGCGSENTNLQNDLPKPTIPSTLSSCSKNIENFVNDSVNQDVECSFISTDKGLQNYICRSLNTATNSDGICVVDCNAANPARTKDPILLHAFDPTFLPPAGIQGKNYFIPGKDRWYYAVRCQTIPSPLNKDTDQK